MTAHRIPAFLFALLMAAIPAVADTTTPPPITGNEPKLTTEGRLVLIRSLNAELVYTRKAFPQGRVGLTLKDGVVTPSDAQIQTMIAGYGPSLKPGDRAKITDIRFKDKSIIFELNGGPEHRKKWYEHIEVGMGDSTVSPGQPTENTNMRGSYVELAFAKYVPNLKPEQIKELLNPVINFNATSPVEAFVDTVPPKVKEALKNHEVLVGMNRDMVILAKGRAPQKHRERDGDTEYEEWIYGVPPQEVQFVRFIGDEVVRLEIMQVSGQKIVRTEKEFTPVAAPVPTTVAKTDQPDASPAPRPANAPSLRRPGEEIDSAQPVATQQRKTGPVTVHPTPPDPRTSPDPSSGPNTFPTTPQ